MTSSEPKAPSRRKLTDAFIKRVKPEGHRTLHWDVSPRNFALCVQPSGRKSYKLIFSLNNRVRWLHIADCDAIGLAEARKIALKLMGEIAQGKDPQAERMAARAAGSFEELSHLYFEHASRRNKSWKQPFFLVKKYLLPKWAKLPAASIKRSDVRAIFDRITADGAPIMANQVVAAASALFAWAIKQEIGGITVNPASGVERNPTLSRERVLSDVELPAFWQAVDQSGLIVSTALKTLLLSGQRPGEVCAMRWEHLSVGKHTFTDKNAKSFKVEGAWWSMPGAPEPSTGWPGTKNGKSHKVWLPQAVVELIAGIDEVKSAGFVFPGPRGKALAGLNRAMAKVCKAIGVEQDNRATAHDLRRSHGSTITALGFGREAMNRIQNHVEGGIADVYDQHGYANENRIIMEAVAQRLLTVATGKTDEGKVVQLHSA
jgi:integrase